MADVGVNPKAIFLGDWRTVARHCGGNVVIADMSVLCEECNMNTWYLPTPDRADEILGVDAGKAYVQGRGLLPPWVSPALYEDVMSGEFKYEPYFVLLNEVHPFTFDDCHDPGDEDEEKWPAWGLYVEALLGRNPLRGGITG